MSLTALVWWWWQLISSVQMPVMIIINYVNDSDTYDSCRQSGWHVTSHQWPALVTGHYSHWPLSPLTTVVYMTCADWRWHGLTNMRCQKLISCRLLQLPDQRLGMTNWLHLIGWRGVVWPDTFVLAQLHQWPHVDGTSWLETCNWTKGSGWSFRQRTL